MNEISEHLTGQFDFCWSACSLEYLGSLDHGLSFIENSLKTLKIHGVAIHTTEFNFPSNKDTLESFDLSLYRKCDVEKLFNKLEQAGHHVEPLDLRTGATFIDGYIDLPPYHNEPHLRLGIAGNDSDAARKVFGQAPFDAATLLGEEPCMQIEFELDRDQKDVELRLYCAKGFSGCIERIELVEL